MNPTFVRRRAFMAAAATTAMLARLPVRAQTAASSPARALAQRPPQLARVGLLLGTEPPPVGERYRVIRVFAERMRELGWTEGQNLQLESRYGRGNAEGIASAAAELTALQPDVLVGSGTAPIRALAQATRTLPIVMAGAGDPVGTGLVASLARPGGNVTGVSLLGQEIVPKTLQLLRELLPKARRIDLVGSAANPGNDFFARVWAEAVRAAGVEGQMVIVPRAEAIESAIAAIRADAIVVLADPMFFKTPGRLFTAATARRLPTANTQGRDYAAAGSLLSYSVNFDDLFRQAAGYVDRILRGAKAADLPVRQPERLALIVNLRTAQAMGLEVPQTALLRADEVLR